MCNKHNSCQKFASFSYGPFSYGFTRPLTFKLLLNIGNFDHNYFIDDSDDDFEMDDPLDEDSEIEEETTGDDIRDDEFTMKEAVILGSVMGWAYEEGLEEGKRRKLEKKMDDDP